MRDDLLDAQAVIDWAVSDLPILKRKIDAWRKDKPYTLIGDLDAQSGKKLIRLANVKPVPDIISAEAGVILHAVRSSLDMLAVALAERNGAIDPKDVYFPIWRDRAAFDNPRDTTGKKIKRLSAADQAAIKNLKPYKGGNHYLAALHELDLTRKHRRLVSVQPLPHVWLVSHEAAANDVRFRPEWSGFQNDAIIATGPAHASESYITLEVEIRFTQPRTVSFKPLIEVLNDFASLASSIIWLFNVDEF
jgi:hypothetical protein